MERKMERKIGLEVEYLLLNNKDKLIVPPDTFDRDDFPLLGEIRSEPAASPHEAVANFLAKKMELENMLKKDHKLLFATNYRVPLKIYKEANKQISGPKDVLLSQVKNIYGIDITNYSDQIIEKGKIQGIIVSCGLHLHFSAVERKKTVINEFEYTPTRIPISGPLIESEENVLELLLYKRSINPNKKDISISTSLLTKGTIYWMVSKLDKVLFDTYAPPESERTKYRQPGFFELKNYGFEYRSLPANEVTMSNLLDITTKAFDILEEATSYNI